MAAVGAGHLILLANPRIERSQARLGLRQRAATQQQGHTQYRASHCLPASSAPQTQRGWNNASCSNGESAWLACGAYPAERIFRETFARKGTEFPERQSKAPQ